MTRSPAFAVAMLLVAAAAVAADSKLDREIARLAAAANAIDAAALPQPLRAGIETHRKALEKARTTSVPEYRLYLLRDPFVGIEALSFVSRERDAGGSIRNFETLWRSRKARFAAKAPTPGGTLLERALAESATTRAERLYAASLPYAKAAEPWSGVYYLAQAEANLRFREFVHALTEGAQAVERTPQRKTIDAELAHLEAAALTFFGGDITNRDLIPVSVRLKEARELLDAERLSGATLLALEARATLSRRGGPRESRGPGAAAPGGSILSLLRAWSESDEQMKSALRDDVVPFYGALFTSPDARRRPTPRRVTVTLVRWPYT